MSEFDDKLGQILSDQNAMEQIMALANSLSGGTGEPAAEGGEGPAPEFPEVGRDARLLEALRPFLKPERQSRLDRMLEILRLLRLMRGT